MASPTAATASAAASHWTVAEALNGARRARRARRAPVARSLRPSPATGTVEPARHTAIDMPVRIRMTATQNQTRMYCSSG